MIGLVLSTVLLTASAPAEQVLVRSDHAEILIGDERYRLVTRQAPLRAVVMNSSGNKRLVINVVRLGDEGSNKRGGTPLKVKVGRRSHVFPNRPSLVDNRRVTRLGEGVIASFPVRYPLKLRRGRQVPIRISLRRPKGGGKVGILLTLEDPQDTLLTPLTPRGERLASAPRSGSDTKVDDRRRRRRARKRGEEGDKERAAADATAADKTAAPARMASARRQPAASAPDAGPAAVPVDAGTVDMTADDAMADAGPPPVVAVPSAPPPPPPPTTGALRVVVVDQMGGNFVLGGADVTIDGRPVVGGPKDGARRVLFDGGLSPGPHDVQIHLAYRVDAGWMFSYLEGYTFHLSEAALVTLDAGDDVRVVVTGEQQGGWFTELEDKPSLDVEVIRK